MCEVVKKFVKIKRTGKLVTDRLKSHVTKHTDTVTAWKMSLIWYSKTGMAQPLNVTHVEKYTTVVFHNVLKM